MKLQVYGKLKDTRRKTLRPSFVSSDRQLIEFLAAIYY